MLRVLQVSTWLLYAAAAGVVAATLMLGWYPGL